MKNKVLAIFKYHRPWNTDVVNSFSNFYEIQSLQINDYKNKNFSEIINDINNIIKSKNIEIVIFDVDYFKFINLFFIQKISCKKKILITGDDFELHEMNAITASSCDIVLTGCPLSKLKYREKGYKAHFINFENSKLKKSSVVKKEIDVLFFGHITNERKKFLDYIVKEGINLKNVGHEAHIRGIPDDELANLISKSKIVLNLSKSRTDSSIKSFSSHNPYKFFYQMKGRIIVAGMNGVLCVSEYSPSQELFFNKDEIPTFYTKDECVEILKKILSDQSLLERYTNKFTYKVNEIFNNENIFKNINKSIEGKDNKRVELTRVPYWYLRISVKQILLRNIKLSTLIKNASQLNLIFEIIKKSNFISKFLILSESILNILWYSLTFTLKMKK